MLSLLMANKYPVLIGLFLASLAGTYYTGYRDGKAHERASITATQNAQLIAFVNEQKKIYDSLNTFKDEVTKDAQTGDRPASDFIKRNVSRLPLPVKPPRKP